MHIRKLSIINFRSVPRLTLDLQRLNCFIGPHNSGKTNILDGITLFWDPYIRASVQQNQLIKISLGQQVLQAPPILSYISNTNTISGVFELELDKGIDSWLENDYLREIFVNTAFLHTQKRSHDYFNRFFKELETITNLSSISAFKFNMNLSQEQLMFTELNCYLRLKNGEFIPFESNDLLVIQQALGSAFIRRFHETSEYEFLNDNISRIIKNKDYKAITAIENFLKDIIGQEFIFELGEYHDHGQDVEVTIEQAFTSPLWRMSTGTIRIISLAYLLTASPVNQIIIIDNPGLYLHPKGQRKLARRLENFSKDHQLIFSTHSTRLLIGHAYLVELLKGWTKIRPIHGEKSMKKVAKLLGIRPSDSLGADVVVFVEGRTDARVFRAFEDILLGNQSRVTKNRVSYIGVGGWTNMKFVISIELLRSKFVRSRALAITDGDIVNSETYNKVKKNWSSVFPENTFFSLKEDSIESLFVNNPIVFLRTSSKIQDGLPSISELQNYINKKRERKVSDKSIVQNILDEFFRRRYGSSVAELLARKFLIHEIPEYIVSFFNEYILQ
ncbi:MAG: ATP-dependent endonuclease [Promethearchaeota archaeon]